MLKVFGKRSGATGLVESGPYISIPPKAIEYTASVLQEYGRKDPPNEGLVYWGGIKNPRRVVVTAVVAPKTISNQGRVETSYLANSEFIKFLNDRGIVHLAQVHSHPGTMVDHTVGDDRMAAFKVNGLISIVVGAYCRSGKLDLAKCGVHVYLNGEFVRLSKSYVKRYFNTNHKENGVILEDLRDH